MYKNFEVDKIALHTTSIRYSQKGSYATKEYTKFKVMIAKHFYSNTPYKIDVPLEVKLLIWYPIPKRWNKKKTEENHLGYKITSPDIDNIAKSILDGMNGFAFDDDKQIALLKLSKCYDKKIDKIKIEIWVKALNKEANNGQ